MELISVIVPVYKVEKYLDKCINSIVNQTYTNLEIILVDDGSPDHCGAMCDAWAKKDGRIKVIHKENGGLSDARNAGMNIATGVYTAFVDSDDWIAVDFIQTLYDIMVENGAQIAGCDVCTVYPDQELKLNGTNQVRICTAEEATGDILHGRGFRAVAWNKLYLSSLLEGERYPLGKFHEDEFFTYRIYGKADKLVYIDRPMYFYLQRQGSIMRSFTIKRLDALAAYLERLEYLKIRFPDLYIRDKVTFCISCGIMYCQALRHSGEEAREIKKKIRKLRRQVSVPLKEYQRMSGKQKLYTMGTGLYIGLFCRMMNLVHRREKYE